MIVIHAVSERTSNKAIEKPKIISPSECAGIVPIVLSGRDLRKGLIDGDSQFFSRQPDFQIHDRGLHGRRRRRGLEGISGFRNLKLGGCPCACRTDSQQCD